MKPHPFTTPFEQLPRTLPIFPLPGAIVMPGCELPLNVFEPRYLNMVADALAGHRLIGMIQPGPGSGDDSGLCRTGCAGRITQYRETSDGRVEMLLRGICRFDVVEELATLRGYRLVVPEWARFAHDYRNADDESGERREALMRKLRRYFELNGMQVDWNRLERLPTAALVNSLSMALPFDHDQKQVLLETLDPADRLAAFAALISRKLALPASVTRH